jgi:hypothetical protein
VSGDIVERLRDCGVFTTTDENGDVQVGMRLVSPKDCNEAADEIERLRAAGDALAEVALLAVVCCQDNEVEQCNRAYAAWQEARRER